MIINKSGFTLLELIVVITIISILSIIIYAPYNLYQNKAKLKLSSREISQSFYEAKNIATSGLKDFVGNRSIGLYLDRLDGNNDKLIFFSYPHDIDDSYIKNIELGDVEIIREMDLQKGVVINYLGGYDNLLFYFKSVTGESKIYTFTGGLKNLVYDDKIDINFSFKNSTSPILNNNLVYFSETNIVDYK